jgi:hypothetical protein|tara:strand:- start:3246 stop:3647 length:402 start_codon:yes stop_codon:yes gene_type:complete
MEDIINDFIDRLDEKLNSVLLVNKRLVEENIKLREQIKRFEKNGPGNYEKQSYNDNTSESFTDKKKIIMVENVKDTTELKFTGNGTFDAKEKIKSFGVARFEKDSRAWIVNPEKTIGFIKENLENEYDLQFLD